MANPVLGLNTRLGIGNELEFGVRVVPTDFFAATSESLVLTETFNPVTVLGQLDERDFVKGKRTVEGSLEIPGTYQSNTAGWLLKNTMGEGSVSTIAASGTAFEHVISPSGSLASGISVYVDRDSDVLGTAYSYNGMQVASLEIAQEVEGILTMTPELMGKDETEEAVVASTPIPDPQYILWDELQTTLSVSGIAISNVCVTDLSVTVLNALADDRYKLGQRLKSGQGRGGQRTVEGSLTVELVSNELYSNFRDNVNVSGNFIWTGQQITGASGQSFSLEMQIPRMNLLGTTPSVADVGIINQELPFKAFIDTENSNEDLIGFKLINSDSTI